ncbi:hypothetical protein QTL97_14535 [Sporosarcina thermotolerans]|uniref:DUF4179 domain-containing protein n=1 Tax=Sporosarcina thermotolerans TaxID=633404 RepID=A0AAW9AAT5_9BACL|nr:hypothetical protein [Sporosarcina thermotolerans]MDW0118149.1 hypothetical protein [Sporosarcina thermotolerans]WHT47638.1 hypothetical protein QNH10_16075 [Sporosarcina thermotolerans]
MNKFIPSEVKDLTESKKKVMRNVLNDIQNRPQKPRRNWRYGVITAVLTMSAMFFVLNEVLTENEPSVAEQPSPTELDIDLSKPTISEEQGLLYLDRVTLGDSQSKVIEALGDNFIIVQEDGSDADFVMDYDGQAKFSFIEDKLNSIVYVNVNEAYFDELFKDYAGFKFEFLHINDDRFFYSIETNQIIQASTEPVKENLIVTLSFAEPHLEKKAEYLYKTDQEIKSQQTSTTDLNVDLAKPTFKEEEGYLYIQGVTLGDSPLKVIERLSVNYIIGQTDGGFASDFLINYDGVARFHFYNNKLSSIVLIKVDKDYFEELFTQYDGFKFISSGPEDYYDRIIYSEKTAQGIKATTHVPNSDLYLYISYPGPELWDNPEMKNIPNIWKEYNDN